MDTYTTVLSDVEPFLESSAIEKKKAEKIYEIGQGDVNAFIELMPTDVSSKLMEDPNKLKKFFNDLHRSSLVTSKKALSNKSLKESVFLFTEDIVYVDATKKDLQKRLIILLTGTVVVGVFVAFLYYRRQRKVFGELYTVKDLFKDLWKLFKNAVVKMVDLVWTQLLKVLATAIVLLLLCMVIVYFLPADFLTREKGSKIGDLIRHVLRVILKVKKFEG